LALHAEGREQTVRTATVEMERLDADDALAERRSAGIGKEGRVTLEHLAPGRWRVQLVRRFFETTVLAETEVDVRAGETARVTLRTDGCAQRGRARGP
jgi:hypothetical protein